jgi:hypothetical protein
MRRARGPCPHPTSESVEAIPVGALGVVEAWQTAVNAGDLARLQAVSAPDIEVGGPRGSGRGHALLGQWLQRAGLRLVPLRWFCGADGTVVVEQEARWKGGDPVRLASSFLVTGGLVARFFRYDELPSALAAAGLQAGDEVRR